MSELKNPFGDMLLNIAEEAKEYNKLKVRVKKLHPDAVIPQYAKDGDAGMDLVAISSQYTQDYISYKTGLAFEIPQGYVGLLFPRSSNSKKNLLLTNSVGVIDSGYRGEVEFRYKLVGHSTVLSPDGNYNRYNIGDRIGQLIIMPYPQVKLVEVTELSDSDRGTGSYGSTGK